MLFSHFILNVIGAVNYDNRRSPVWYVIILYFAQFSAFILVFCIDGLYIPNKTKKLILGIMSISGLAMTIRTYFRMGEVEWNPFEDYNFSHTQISFKSLFLSSSGNLVLFLAKPILSDMMRYLRRKCCVWNPANVPDSSNHRNRVVKERCVGLYKRSHVRWQENTESISVVDQQHESHDRDQVVASTYNEIYLAQVISNDTQ